MKPGLSTILFDLGNVVFHVDFDPCFQYWSKLTNRPVAELKHDLALDKGYAAYERNELSGHEYCRHVCETLEIDLTYAQFQEGWNSIFGPLVAETVDFLLTAQNKLNLYAFSNTNEMHREFWSRKYSHELSAFKKIFCSHQMGMRKPEARAFTKILSELDLRSHELVFIDDLEENIRGADALGIASILFDKPDQAITKLRQIIRR